MSYPTRKHMKATNHVLRYLKTALGNGIMLGADSKAHLSTCCDLEYASCLMGRKSTTGYAI